MVESQPSKLLVAGSIPVSRSRSLVAWCAVEGDVAQLVEHSLGKRCGNERFLRALPRPKKVVIFDDRRWKVKRV